MQEREKERETSMKKTLFTKRLLCGALAAAVVFSCFPAGSAAAEESRTTDQSSSELLITRENERKTLDFNTDWLFIRGNDLSAKEPDYDESMYPCRTPGIHTTCLSRIWTAYRP